MQKLEARPKREEILSTAREGLKPNFPKWLDRAIQSKVGRFVFLPQEIKDTSFGNGATSFERQFPMLVRNAYSSIQQDLSSPKETSSILHAMENLEYRLIVLELSRGINSQRWRIYDYSQENIVIVAHPNFINTQEFSGKLVEAIRASRRRTTETGIQNSFGITSSETPGKDVVFLVEDDDVWKVTGTEQLRGKMDLWWVRELGDNLGLYYTKGRENLDNATILASNRFHEFVHRCQKEVLSTSVYDRLFSEFSLLEGMACWWEPLLVRKEYRERDFLTYHLLVDKFMATFLNSDQLLSREGHKSLMFPWNAVFTGMVFQKIGALARMKNQKVQSYDTSNPISFDYELVKEGLRIVSRNLSLANELTDETTDNLTKHFLDTLCNKEFGQPLSFEELVAHYDLYGYDYGYSLVSTQSLTDEERKSLEKQRKQYLEDRNR